ncbi:MAG TPA: response regulator [Gemmatimonadales bacterium]|nr:response regulator [Gemmatimonadales bacterium]
MTRPGECAAGERSRLRILLVDDDPAMARLACQILRAHGFPDPAHVATGTGALAAADGVDVVLLDQQLPDRNGLEVLAALRTRPDRPAVILVTAHGSESLAARALREGADDYLAKDASLADLLPQVLERVRRTRALRDALAAAERDLLRAERLAAVGEMTVTLHHEINNPLMAATAEVELLLSNPDGLPEHALRGLGEIKGSLARIRDILRRVGDLGDARSTSYLGDVRMIDLAPAGAVRAVRRGTAVLHVADENVARVCALLLRTAGFHIKRAAGADDLARAARAIDVTLVLVAMGAGSTGTEPLAALQPPRDRSYRLIVLVPDDGAAARAAGADHVVTMPFDPGTLIGEVLGVLDGR